MKAEYEYSNDLDDIFITVALIYNFDVVATKVFDFFEF